MLQGEEFQIKKPDRSKRKTALSWKSKDEREASKCVGLLFSFSPLSLSGTCLSDCLTDAFVAAWGFEQEEAAQEVGSEWIGGQLRPERPHAAEEGHQDHRAEQWR